LNALASVIRGTGNMLVPALAVSAGVVLLVPLSPCLIFGLGPFPALGIEGAGIAVVSTTALTAAVLALYLAAGRVVLAPEAPDTAELLKDGVNAALVPPGDLEALLTTLRRVTSDTALAERLSAGATEAAQGLTWDSRAARIRDFITARLAVTP